MINLNGKDYKLYFLDTCALSVLVKDKSGFGSDLMNLVLADGIMAFSINSIWELKSAPTVYKDVLEVVSYLPAVVLKTEEMIFEDEYKKFVEPTHPISPYITSFFSPMFKKYGIDLLKIVEEKITDEKIELAKNVRKELFEKLKKRPSNIYTRDDLKDQSLLKSSVQLCAFQLATHYKMSEIEKYIKEKAFPVNEFPSLISIAYFLHYKYLQIERKGFPSDVEDILMAALYPYVDVVVTERNQCEIIRQVKKHSDILNNLQFFNLTQVKSAS